MFWEHDLVNFPQILVSSVLTLTKQQTRMSKRLLSDISSRQLEYLIDLTAPDMWTPEVHDLYSRKFRENIRATLLAAHVGASLCSFPRRPVHPLVALECLELMDPEDSQVLGAIVAAGDPEEDEYEEEESILTLTRREPSRHLEDTEDEDIVDYNLLFKRRRLE